MEKATWIFVGRATAAYLWKRKAEIEAKELPKGPVPQREVDPTRWRHDGTQPLTKSWGDGNRAPFPTPRVYDLIKSL